MFSGVYTGVSGLAYEIFDELGSPSDLTTGTIIFWLKNNIGKLNNHIREDFIVSSGEIYPQLDISERDIYKTIFNIYYYDKQIRTHLGAAANNAVIEVSENGATVRMINKNTVATTYITLKKNEVDELRILVNAYKLNLVSPLQVAGDDTVAMDGLTTKELNRI